MEEPPQRDLTRTLLGAIFIGALIVASLWILRPFLAAAIWATMIVVATWPVLLWQPSGAGAGLTGAVPAAPLVSYPYRCSVNGVGGNLDALATMRPAVVAGGGRAQGSDS